MLSRYCRVTDVIEDRGDVVEQPYKTAEITSKQ